MARLSLFDDFITYEGLKIILTGLKTYWDDLNFENLGIPMVSEEWV